MNAEPLSKSIYDRARELGVTHIRLLFSGGSDEGYLDINIVTKDQVADEYSALKILENDIENWAWDVYEYSGAGDGASYGDEIEYDLVDGKVTTSEWYEVRKESEPESLPLKLA